MRLRNKKWAENYLNKSKLIIKSNLKLKKINKQLFKNKNKLHIEIGMGKGTFLETMFIQNKNNNFVGIEKEKSVIAIPTKRYESNYPNFNNIKLYNGDFSQFSKNLKKNQVDYIYINFPDPWPKTKHHKRRLMNQHFLSIYQKILKKNGIIEFKSDQKILFDYFFNELKKIKKLKAIEFSENLHENKSKTIIMTEYEKKFTILGNNIYYIKIQKM